MDAEVEKKVVKKIEEIFRRQFLDNSLIVRKETSPLEIESWDSLTHISLLSAIEKEFKLRFTAEEMAKIDSVEKIIVCIDSRVAG
jgi:acyl carrier protein